MRDSNVFAFSRALPRMVSSEFIGKCWELYYCILIAVDRVGLLRIYLTSGSDVLRAKYLNLGLSAPERHYFNNDGFQKD